MPEVWHDFYVLLGTASAALVALLFVATSIGASFLTPERSIATRTFITPVVFHYSTILVLSLIALMPTHSRASLALCVGAAAAVGIVYSAFVIVQLWRIGISDLSDHLGYGGLPLAAYAAVLAAAMLMAAKPAAGPVIMAWALIALLGVNIRNAWDLMLAFAQRVASRNSHIDTTPPSP